MMKLYQEKIFPYLMNKNLSKPEIIDYRRQLLRNVSGKILEIGIGTGLNLNLYPEQINEITAVDPFPRVLPPSRITVNLYPDDVEDLHFMDDTFDTVVSTFTLCSVESLHETVKEIARVLKPHGKYLFLEHGQAETRFARRMQNIANPLYHVWACGCNVNRDYRQVIAQSGFEFEKYIMHRANIAPTLLTGYLYEGVARNAKDKVDISGRNDTLKKFDC